MVPALTKISMAQHSTRLHSVTLPSLQQSMSHHCPSSTCQQDVPWHHRRALAHGGPKRKLWTISELHTQVRSRTVASLALLSHRGLGMLTQVHTLWPCPPWPEHGRGATVLPIHQQ